MKPRIVVIVGPTASGKSDFAIKLAQKLNGEIISADSRQVYRGMNIGTGKVIRDISLPLLNKYDRIKIATNKKNLLYYSMGIPHHLIDVANPKRPPTGGFSVALFKKLAQRAIKDILKRKKLPIVVGGTGQYIDTLIYDLALPEVPPNRKLRAKLEKQTTEQLFRQLQKLDPERAGNIDRHNPRRLIRALEIVMTTGKPVPPLVSKSHVLSPKSYEVLWLGLNPKDLQKRIARRLAQRFRQGMVAEVKKLHAGGVSWQRLYDFGLEYRWLSLYLQNKITLQEMKDNLYHAIVQYSKRQMTWFKRNKKIRWIKNEREATRLYRAFLA